MTASASETISMGGFEPQHVCYVLAWIQGSATGLPLTKTTIVGVPVAFTACTSFNWAPTSPKLDRSTCSPVVALVPGVHRSVWSSDQVPTMTRATSEICAVDTASANPDSSLDHNSQPCAKLIFTDVPDSNCVKPANGLMPLREALKNT